MALTWRWRLRQSEQVPLPVARMNQGLLVDRRELRGLPMIGHDVAGVSPGTDPVAALLWKEHAQASGRIYRTFTCG
jgi:hypothetical protein